MGDPALSLALSPLLQPLRFASRAGVARLNGLEALVAKVVEQARAYAGEASGPKLDRLAQSVRGFDSANEAERQRSIAALVRELGALLPIPLDVSSLARPMSEGPGKLPAMAASAPAAKVAADPLATPVIHLRGVGPALAGKLDAKGLRTVGDLLLNLPRAYEDRRTPRTVAQAPVGERSVIAGIVVKAQEAHGRRRRLEVLVQDDAGSTLVCIWFHYRQSFLQRFPLRAPVLVSGEVRQGYRGGGKVMHHPDVELLAASGEVAAGKEDDSFGRVVPVYTEVEGVPPRTFRRIEKRALDEYVRFVDDLLPEPIRRRRKLLPLREALREAHFPERFAAELARGVPGGEPRRRLAFEELFLVQLGLALRRRGVKVEPGIAFRAEPQALAGIVSALPWPLTRAQARAVAEIASDMRRAEPMNRLLQGDVGSGKTAVALCAARLAVADGYQAALMAPTEILAEQHARSLRSLLRGAAVHVELVSGGLSQRERDHAARLLRSGTAQIVVGTHALAEDATFFHKLGLVIIDEQHRFGVMTRANLMSKGHRPDVLVMTATPIPRTLALTLYGDLDVSVLDELPPGRTPIATRVFKDAAREKAYEVIRRELHAGRQAYVVLPLVEESEKLADLKAATRERDRLALEVFPGVPIGLVHGRQPAAERNEEMERFRRGETRLLVATTVIEVGLDVPNATVMLIEHAERFGLSQLHQLRGRVGRGAARSHCLLITGTSGAEWGPAARKRLEVMEKTTDGFRIAEEDLELRGPGEFLGTRQSGLPDFAVAELARDQNILKEAREEAFALVDEDPELSSPENAALKHQLLDRFRGRLSLARVG
ncbi:MAG TPA: ATP-dependent DNA helicase RecG [Myxococcales bacterium]|nr:ATP-dependent DNA helicase RecG [Myxococcales bacterium]